MDLKTKKKHSFANSIQFNSIYSTNLHFNLHYINLI